MKNKFLIYLCILLFGGLGIYLTFISGNMKRFDSETTAYKIDVNEQNDSDGTIYYPKYYFKVNRKNYVCESKSGSSAYPKDSKNKVYYDSSNPEKCVTEYEKSNSTLAGIICLIVAVVIFILTIKKPTTNTEHDVNRENIDLEKQYKMEEAGQKAIEIIEKAQLIYKRVVLGIIIIVLLGLVIFDALIFKQTIEAKDYIDVVATYVEEKDNEEDSVFNDYIYTFKDKKGNNQEIVISYANDYVAPEKVKIKYNENNPQDFYEEGGTFSQSGIIWFVVKIIALVLLIILFFNKKLLSKVSLSVNRN